MHVDNFDNKSAYLRAAKISGNGSLVSKVESFTNTFTTHALKEKPALVPDTPVIRNEKQLIMNKLLESFVLESEARRIGVLNKRSREDEEPFDTLGQCIGIARRIIRGEEVADEEISILEEQFPELLSDQLSINANNTNVNSHVAETVFTDEDVSIDTIV